MGRKKTRHRHAPAPHEILGDDPGHLERKDAQLCAQVREALSFALADSDDGLLVEATVLAVEPAPHIGHLRVLVEIPAELDPDAVHARLTASEGALRYEVGSEISRKKVPSLSFVVVPEGVARDD